MKGIFADYKYADNAAGNGVGCYVFRCFSAKMMPIALILSAVLFGALSLACAFTLDIGLLLLNLFITIYVIWIHKMMKGE